MATKAAQHVASLSEWKSGDIVWRVEHWYVLRQQCVVSWWLATALLTWPQLHYLHVGRGRFDLKRHQTRRTGIQGAVMILWSKKSDKTRLIRTKLRYMYINNKTIFWVIVCQYLYVKKIDKVVWGRLRPSLFVTSIEEDFAAIEHRPPLNLPAFTLYIHVQVVRLYVSFGYPKMGFFLHFSGKIVCWMQQND